MPKTLKFFALVAATLLALYAARYQPIGLVFSGKQILSMMVFSTFIYGTLLFGEFRLAFAFGGIAVLMGLNLLTVQRFTESASLDVIIFLVGTFLVIGYLEESRFFEHVVNAVVRWVGPRPQWLLMSLMFTGSIASALVGEVTAVLFIAGTMLHLTTKYKLNPIPFVIMLVFACNVGSAMSSVGNPIGVLIALKTGLSFVDFLKWAAPVALVVDVVTFAICRWWFADSFHQFAAAVQRDFEANADGGPQADHPDFGNEQSHGVSWTILLSLILLLVTHHWTEHLLHLRDGTMMVAAALVMGSVVLFLKREQARDLVEHRVDWWTLSFFMMLFASVGTLEDTKVTLVLADRLSYMSHASQWGVIQIVGWSTGWLSAFLDNVLAVATFMPVVHDIRLRAGVPYDSSIYWFMLFGGTFMGNMTIIGSTANIVALGLLEKRGHGTIGFGYWMKIGFLVSIASMLVAMAMLMLMNWAFGIPLLAPPTAGAAPLH